MMKHIIVILIVLFHIVVARAQSSTKNYVKEITARTEQTGSIDFRSEELTKVKVSYFDGFGRLDQTVMREASPGKKDIVSVLKYDQFGRMYRVYLPYESAGISGAYRNSWSSELSSFYGGFMPDDDEYYYSETSLESSPLSRVTKEMAPGASWVGSSRGVSISYETNESSEVLLFHVDNDGFVSTLGDGYYDAGELYKVITTDEDQKSMVEFSDKKGQVVCKRTYPDASSQASTYYLYDDFGLLRYVIQPQGISEMGTDWTEMNNISFRDQWTFQYQYDDRQRMILKKVPGAEPVYMVYDQRDRVVLTQDGNQRGVDVKYVGSNDHKTKQYEWVNYHIGSGGSVTLEAGFSFSASEHREFYIGENAQAVNGEWTYTKYDVLNRPVMTGIVSLSGSRESIQEAINANSSHSFTESYEGNTAGDLYGYDNNGYPSGVGSTSVLTVTYYDDYRFVSDLGWGSNYISSGHNYQLKGLVSGGYTRVLGSTTLLKSVTYYDSQLRPEKSITQSLLGREIIETTYRNKVSPLVSSTLRTHKKTGSSDLTISEVFTYDHMDRLITTTHQIGSGPVVTIQSNSYNELGELKEKNIGNNVQSIDFAYNIRGWLANINGPSTLPEIDVNPDKYSMELLYQDAPSGYKQYNGNIGQVKWKSSGGDQLNYKYTYDNLNRLSNAYYENEDDASTDFQAEAGPFTYDFNGNISSLSRHGQRHWIDLGGGAGFNTTIIDQLTYQYEGNQLLSVSEAYEDNNVYGFDDGNTSGDDYAYDANGNMIIDLNKTISNISYNHLNLPEAVSTPDGTIHYTYDAAGTKLRKYYDKNSGADETTDYLGGIHYKDGTLDFIQHAEGRARKSGSSFAYEYNLTDHLGNVRVTVNSSGTVIQRDDYYPFGLTFNSYTSGTENLYKYAGNEDQKEWSVYDFNARMYDPALGRFNSTDPMSDQRDWLTPYNYVQNNPMMRVDPSGMLDWIPEVNEDGSTQYVAEEGDNIATFAEQYGLSVEEAREVFSKDGYKTEALSNEGKDLKTGDAISGESVAEVTGSEVLKMDWQSGVATDSRRIDQVLFAMEYSKESGSFYTSDFFQNVPYFHDGQTNSFSNAAVLNGTTSKLDGSNQPISMTFNHRTKLPIRTYSNGRQQQYLDTFTGTYYFNFVNANGASRPIPQATVRIKGQSNMKAFTRRLGFEYQGYTNTWSPLKK